MEDSWNESSETSYEGSLYENFMCGICFDPLSFESKDIRSFDCNFSVCGDCFQKIAKTATAGKIACPHCKEDHVAISTNRVSRHFLLEKVQERKDMEELNKKLLSQFDQEKICSLHKREKELLCDQDGLFICCLCKLFGEHKDHEIRHVDEIKRVLAEAEKYKKLLESRNCLTFEKDAIAIREKIEKNKTKLQNLINDSCNDFINEVNKVRSNLIEEINKIFETMQRLSGKYLDSKKEIETRRKQALDKLDKLGQAIKQPKAKALEKSEDSIVKEALDDLKKTYNFDETLKMLTFNITNILANFQFFDENDQAFVCRKKPLLNYEFDRYHDKVSGKIFVRNLDRKLDQEKVKDFFSIFGQVKETEMLYKNKEFNGCAYITFDNEEAGKIALLFNNAVLWKKNMKIEPFVDEKPIFVREKSERFNQYVYRSDSD